MAEIKIYAGDRRRGLRASGCAPTSARARPTETTASPEGNSYVKIGEHVRDEEVYLVQPIGRRRRRRERNDDFVELLFWMDAFKRSGAKYVTAVIPYFSYAKGDKKDEPRVSIRARVSPRPSSSRAPTGSSRWTSTPRRSRAFSRSPWTTSTPGRYWRPT